MGKSFKEYYKELKDWLNKKVIMDRKESEDPLNRRYLKYMRNRLIFALLGFLIIISLGPFLLHLKKIPLDEDIVLDFIFTGALFLGIMLIDLFIIGLYYVSEDSKRRMMSPTLWVLICLLVPYFLGFALYFLVRRPIPLSCPRCKFIVPNGSKHCPNCGFQLRISCPKCGAPLPENSNFCPQCGTSLKS